MIDHSVGLGDVLASKYRVERVLGAGGMGMVLAARHLVLGSVVAIKLMNPRMLQRARGPERFLREAQAAARLTSQHVARVLDVGLLETGAPYIVMEHLRGTDLATLLDRRGPLPVEEAVEYVLHACEAVGEAHGAGIVHRDLKPANLFLVANPDGSPCVKVLDFGIAKMRGPNQPSTSSNFVSVGYSAPEQVATGAETDARTDVWALGVTLYELISGRKPFEATSLDAFVQSVLFGFAAPLRGLGCVVPDALDRAVLRCLEKLPEHRFPDVAQLATELQPFAPSRAATYAARVGALLRARTEPLPPVEVPATTTAPLSADTEPLPAAEPTKSPPALEPALTPPFAVTRLSDGGARRAVVLVSVGLATAIASAGLFLVATGTRHFGASAAPPVPIAVPLPPTPSDAGASPPAVASMIPALSAPLPTMEPPTGAPRRPAAVPSPGRPPAPKAQESGLYGARQ